MSDLRTLRQIGSEYDLPALEWTERPDLAEVENAEHVYTTDTAERFWDIVGAFAGGIDNVLTTTDSGVTTTTAHLPVTDTLTVLVTQQWHDPEVYSRETTQAINEIAAFYGLPRMAAWSMEDGALHGTATWSRYHIVRAWAAHLGTTLIENSRGSLVRWSTDGVWLGRRVVIVGRQVVRGESR